MTMFTTISYPKTVKNIMAGVFADSYHTPLLKSEIIKEPWKIAPMLAIRAVVRDCLVVMK